MVNNNLSILPFYTSINKQNHRKDYAFSAIYPLFTPDKKIPPFQIIRSHRSDNVALVTLRRLDGTLVADITNQLIDTGLQVNQYTALGYDVIVYRGLLPIITETTEGQYYIMLNDGVEQWYSEVFTVVRSVDQYLRLSYSDTDSLLFDDGRIDFSNNFKFRLYLPAQVGRPSYDFSEQVDDRDGFKFIEKQISEKTYRFNFLAPEYLLDAMRVIRMMDNIEIVSNGDTYTVNQFLMTPKWQEGGYLASVEVEFQCNTIVKKIGQGYTPTVLGDYNDDYNDDYDIT